MQGSCILHYCNNTVLLNGSHMHLEKVAGTVARSVRLSPSQH